MGITEVLLCDPMCQIRDYKVTRQCGTYAYTITGFIDMDGSYGINGSVRFHMKDKSFDASFNSKNELIIEEGMNCRFSDIYTRRLYAK